jgi:hypothetical protein
MRDDEPRRYGGFAAPVGVASAFAGGGAALDSGSINVAKLKDFFPGQVLTSDALLANGRFLQESLVLHRSGCPRREAAPRPSLRLS